MAEILFKTKGNEDPREKPRVFFTCHPDDFESCFHKVCSDLFRTHDCAVFYTPDMTAVVAEEDRATDLDRNNLFVIPVTLRFLTTPNRAREHDFPYAIQNCIPVLPIIMEPGIEGRYAQSDVFGDIQYLNPYSDDATEIPYHEKLNRYLETVLIGGETAKRIRAAFDAYIFLSYRKKDRRYANELMRLIHNQPACQNLAIWFDEFLTPGENFAGNIAKILSDSKLFTLLVTPNLLEEPDGKPNYVMREEFPAAIASGIEILPAELEITDKEQLRDKFSGIPECVDPHDESFCKRLSAVISKIAVSEQHEDPVHNYLIGLAYLEGIDVEVDRKRAVSLIKDSAEMDLPEAIEKLICMYTDGVGVNRDRETAYHWSHRLASHFFAKSFCDATEDAKYCGISELFEHYKNPYWSDAIRLFLLQADENLDYDGIKELYGIISSLGICDYTLLLNACKEMQQHQQTAQELLVSDILRKSAEGIYPPYGPLFWYVPEYDLYVQLLAALEQMKGHCDFCKALALVRDVCWIFGHYHTVFEVTDHVDGPGLMAAAQAISGVRKGLCELFYTGQTAEETGNDIYPRCFNLAEAHAFLENGCGISGRMSTAFDDELGLYQHEMYSKLDDAWIGIIAAPYDALQIEEKLAQSSGRKIRGLFLAPSHEHTMRYIAFNCRHVQMVYIPENIMKISMNWDRYMPITQDMVFLNGDILYHRGRICLPEGMTEIGTAAFGYCGMLKEIRIPDSVTNICDRAFYGCGSLASVEMTGSVTSIGDHAFANCVSLPSVNLPNVLKTLGKHAFESCKALTSVAVPGSVLSVGESAFFGCTSLKSVQLLDGVTEIEEGAFYGCSALESVDFPDSLTTIGMEAFYDCKMLRTVSFPDRLREIGWEAFRGCKMLECLVIPECVATVSSGAFRDCTGMVSVTLPRHAAEFASDAFAGCSALKAITLPEGITVIEAEAFKNCKSLESLVIPNSVTEIGYEAFSQCCALTSVTIPDGVESIGEWAFRGCKGLKAIHNCPEGYVHRYLGVSADVLIRYRDQQLRDLVIEGEINTIQLAEFMDRRDIASVDIKSAVREIDSFAFSGCVSLMSVTLPDSLTKIGIQAFRNCMALKEIRLPHHLKEISDDCFSNCQNLTSVVIPNGLQKIGINAFHGCKSLQSLVFPDSIVKIAHGAFSGCVGLQKIENCPNWCTHRSLGVPKYVELQYSQQKSKEIVISGSVASQMYESRKDIDVVRILEGVTAIGNQAFAFSSVASVELPTGLTEIGGNAFKYCWSLTDIVLPRGLITIGGHAFSDCKNLKSVALPEGLKQIREFAFGSCSSLAAIDIPDSVSEMQQSAFCSCITLKTVKLPRGLPQIECAVFEGCRSLTAINIPDSVERIGPSAFKDCASLSSVSLPQNLTTIGDGAFCRCTSMESVQIRDQVTWIGEFAFASCTSLSSVYIPLSVREIGSRAFEGCTGLQEITIPRRFEEELPRIFAEVDLSDVELHWI